MKDALNIYKRAWYHLSKDWLATIKVFLPPTLICILLATGMFFAMKALGYTIKSFDGVTLFGLFAFALFLFVIITSSAVNFHRYALQNEEPTWIPSVDMLTNIGYILRSILIGLVLLLILFIPSLFLIGSKSSILILIFLTPVEIFAYYIMTRLSAGLAGYATGNQFGLGDAFDKSAEHKMTFLCLSLIYFGIEFIYKIIAGFDPTGFISSAINVFAAILAIAVITASYEFLQDQDQDAANEPAA